MVSSDTKLLQAILNGQKALEERLSTKIDKVDKKTDILNEKLDHVNDRLDKQGAQLAYLEDDAPTIKEFNSLKRRIKKLESIVYK